jgi:hypothetical protein
MKYYLFILSVIFTLIGINYGCNNSIQPESTSVISLISNPSFEINGAASLAGWTISDTSNVRLAESAPTNGGLWSLRIAASPFPGSYAYIFAPMEEGKHSYRLSFWCKHTGVTFGIVRLYYKNLHMPWTSLNAQPVEDTLWTFHSFVDTVFAFKQDSLSIYLYGGEGGEESGQTFFDLCKLDRLD